MYNKEQRQKVSHILEKNQQLHRWPGGGREGEREERKGGRREERGKGGEKERI